MSFWTNPALLIGRKKIPPPVFVSSATGSASPSTTVTINKPAGAAVGDLLVAVVWAFSASGVSSTPAGWTVVASLFSGTFRYAVYAKIVDGSEGGSFSFSLSSSAGRNGQILCFRGGVGAVDVVGSKTENTSATIATASSLAATKAGLLLAFFVVNSQGRTVSADPAGMTQRAFLGGGSMAATAYELTPSPAGATPSKTLTWSGTGATVAGLQVQIY